MRIPLFRALAAALVLGTAGCLRSPNADAEVAETITAIGEELSALRQENADLQVQMDSLRLAMARQDTLLRRLAGMAGMPVP